MLPNCGGDAALPNCGGVDELDPKAGTFAAGVFDALNEKPVFGLAALKLKAGELPPKEGGADKAEFAFSPSAGFAPKIPGAGDWLGVAVLLLLFDWPKTNGALAVVFVLGLPNIPCGAGALAALCAEF